MISHLERSSSLRRYGLDSNGIEGLRDVADALAAVQYPCETGSRQAPKGFMRSRVRSSCTQLRVHFCCERAASGENDAESNDHRDLAIAGYHRGNDARRGRARFSRWRELPSKLGNNVDVAAFQSYKDY